MRLLIAFVSGLLFGLGLLYSGMANPAVVQGFLDPFGDWNPALLWVMVGALVVSTIGVIIARRRKKTLTGDPLNFPINSKINRDLIVGGLIFGVGWGLVGICPGPAFVLLGRGLWEGVIFVIAMLVGMKLVSFFKNQ
ncbi:hypothetical protein DC083_03570 [Ignatzschineria ureiclastica]|uniref:YeeE/YedE family protein n=1 Tax=Ignatzschineria ureiclastica TaxID=472582 RepID=A0A2U2AFV1_9GAMM|nr:DUF6691 family protein [Ignatzschineria ureiclastica]PWD81532.1 hypothetical protein DC083_03570 [Ignatzschineria ureiclastica]GHA01427.1 membrane protein [Ignatzschineria ureiclastica]